MKRLNTPTAIVLFPESSPHIARFSSKLREQFPFEDDTDSLPAQLAGFTNVTIEKGLANCLSDPLAHRFLSLDPLEEQDLVLTTHDTAFPSIEQCCDILNFACPAETHQFVTLTAQPDIKLESGYRVSVVCARQRDIESLDSNVTLFDGKKLFGPAAILLGVAKKLEHRAFCIVIEYAAGDCLVSTSAIKSALRLFSQVTRVEILRGQMSEQAIRMHKHLKEIAKKRNEEYRTRQTETYLLDKSPYESSSRWTPDSVNQSPTECIEQQLRESENVAWIERLFEEVNDDTKYVDQDLAVYLKSELDRFGLYDQFEKRFLDLFSKKNETRR